MSLKTLIQEALGDCDTRTIEQTIANKSNEHTKQEKNRRAHIQKELVYVIKEYCKISKLHSDVQALIDECLEQPLSAQIELLEHFKEQLMAWRSVYDQLDRY